MARYSIMKAPSREAQDKFAESYTGKTLPPQGARVVGEAALHLAATLVEASNDLPQPIQNLALMTAIETLHQMWQEALDTTTPAFQETTLRILSQSIESARAQYDAAAMEVEAEHALGIHVPKGNGTLN